MLEHEQSQIPPQPTLEVPRNKRGKIQWRILEEDPAKLTAVIESEVNALLAHGVQLNHRELVRSGYSYLSRAIVVYYPNGYLGIRQTFDLPTGNKPKNFWANPERISTIQQETRAVYQEEGTLSLGILRTRQRDDLVNAIKRYYPGGITKLKEDLGVTSESKPHGYWTPEKIKEEATVATAEHGTLSRSTLHKIGRRDLEAAIGKHYPGGFRTLKADLGIESTQKPQGYWTTEVIFKEASEFYSSFGTLTQSSLANNEAGDLLHAVNEKYPGGLRQLQRDIGLENQSREKGYWNEETIRSEAIAFYEQYGGLSYFLLNKNGRSDIANALAAYPDILRKLQGELGVKTGKKPNGYWTIENIEAEASKFLSEHGELTVNSLRREGQNSLSFYIGRRYPGGLVALRERLGITVVDNSVTQVVSSESANAQLERLLEE